MPHDTPLITTIVAALVLAFIFGAIANRLKMPPLVGYLIAGMVVGPHSPGFVADQTLASQLADLGVVLLMFGVGLNFSMSELLSVKAVAVPGALIRIVLATAMGMALGISMGWSVAGGLVFGLGLAVSSTVVTLKVLQDRHLIDSDRGRVAVGWLVVEDLAMVLALVLIPVFAGVAGGSTADQESDAFIALAEQLLHTHLVLWEVIVVTIIKLLAFVGFMVVVGRRIIPYVLHMTAHTGSRELFRLAQSLPQPRRDRGFPRRRLCRLRRGAGTPGLRAAGRTARDIRGIFRAVGVLPAWPRRSPYRARHVSGRHGWRRHRHVDGAAGTNGWRG